MTVKEFILLAVAKEPALALEKQLIVPARPYQILYSYLALAQPFAIS